MPCNVPVVHSSIGISERRDYSSVKSISQEREKIDTLRTVQIWQGIVNQWHTTRASIARENIVRFS